MKMCIWYGQWCFKINMVAVWSNSCLASDWKTRKWKDEMKIGSVSIYISIRCHCVDLKEAGRQ